LVSVAEISPEVVAFAAEPEIFAPAFAVAQLSPQIVVLVADPEVVLVAVVSLGDVAESLVFADIAVAFAVLVPASVFVVKVDSSRRPKFLVFPNVDHFASLSSSDEVVGMESVHSSTGALANYDLYNILSNPGRYQNRKLGHDHNNPTPGQNNVSDTNDLPIDATTSHSRKRDRHQYRDRRKHRYPVSLLTLGVRQIR